MEIEFSFRKEESGIFGPILRPVARVIFINKKKEVPECLYVDSGADVTLIPKSVGEILGLTIKNPAQISQIKGIGEKGIPIVVQQIKIKIGEKVINSRVAWSLIEEVPMLLGRLDVFKLFNITFVKNKKTIFKDFR